MALIIDDNNFNELEAEKYWSFAKSYKGDPKEETKNMIFSNDYVGARKMDGAYFRFIKDMDGNMSLQGRSRGISGSFLDKIDHVPHLMPFFNSLPNGTCLLGEIYFPNNEGSSNVTTIMGCLTDKAVARQEKGDKLHYYIFDIWAYDGNSLMKEKIENRIEGIEHLREDWEYRCSNYNLNSYTEFARYYDGKELWDELGKILAAGGEGVVITKKGTIPSPGKRTARKTLKIKKEIQQTIDCFFTGRATAPTKLYSGKEIETWPYWINKIDQSPLNEGEHYGEYSKGAPIEPVTKPYFYKWAGSLEIGVLKNGVVTPIGFLSGLSDEIKANFKDYEMKPIEVTAMEILPTGGLRHAKMLQFRLDLSIEDCTYEKIMG